MYLDCRLLRCACKHVCGEPPIRGIITRNHRSTHEMGHQPRCQPHLGGHLSRHPHIALCSNCTLVIIPPHRAKLLNLLTRTASDLHRSTAFAFSFFRWTPKVLIATVSAYTAVRLNTLRVRGELRRRPYNNHVRRSAAFPLPLLLFTHRAATDSVFGSLQSKHAGPELAV